MKTVLAPVIKTDEDLAEALARAEVLLKLDGDEADDELRILALVIQEYENEHIRFRTPDPIEILQFVIDERGLRPKDLVPYIGSQPRVSEVLSRKRRLTVDMIRNLSDGLGIPAAALVGASDSASAA